MTVRAVGTPAADQPLRPMDITRREVGPHDVRIQIVFCGICHSDLAAINGDLVQAARERTIGQLKSGKLDILVATDVAARGLDDSWLERASKIDKKFAAFAATEGDTSSCWLSVGSSA